MEPLEVFCAASAETATTMLLHWSQGGRGMASGFGNGCWGGKVIFRNGGRNRSRDGGSSSSDRSNMFLAAKGQLSFFLHSLTFSF